MTHELLAACWGERLAECARSGMSVTRWCADHAVSTKSFYYWRRKLKATASPHPQEAPNWLALSVGASSVLRESSLTVRIGSASIDVTTGFDPKLLRQIALALEPGQC